MSFDNFTSVVDQLAEIGHDHLSLTPRQGDIFVDKQLNKKIEFLETHDGIRKYEFITNLISASHETLDILMKSKKLESMYISLYGHNSTIFQKLTRRPKLQYDRLLQNLEL